MANRMLLIFAHPDDESFATGGTILEEVSQGAEVFLACATKGEAGKTADLCEKEELGRIREQELKAAAKLLGISELFFLDVLDKEVPDANSLEILEKLVRILRRVRPQVVVTFGPDGASGHRDHIAIHYWTKTAVELAGKKLMPEWGEPFELPRLVYVQSVWRAQHEKIPQADFIVPTAQWAEKKWQAICTHKTQAFSRRRFDGMTEEERNRYFSSEFFVCDKTLSVFPGGGNHLFDGLKEG